MLAAVCHGKKDLRIEQIEDRPLGVQRPVVPEVVPQAQRDGGQLEPAAPAAAVGQTAVTIRVGDIDHGYESRFTASPTAQGEHGP